jgi:hypothetical protein
VLVGSLFSTSSDVTVSSSSLMKTGSVIFNDGYESTEFIDELNSWSTSILNWLACVYVMKRSIVLSEYVNYI